MEENQEYQSQELADQYRKAAKAFEEKKGSRI